MVTRTILVGDTHGCCEEALELLDACHVTSSDRVIFLGDLCDRGPDPIGCIKLAMQHESVLGNHEDKHLRDRANGVALSKLAPHHRFTVERLTEETWNFLSSLPLVIRLPEFNVVAIHAGMWPDVSIDQQDRYHLLHLQCVGADKKSGWPSKSSPGTFWTNYWKGPEKVVFGHTGFNRPLNTEFAVGIDTGCVFGRELTAYVLPDDRFVQVTARKRYYDREEHPVIGKTKWNTLIPVHGDVCTFS